MPAVLVELKCLTSLHVGNGENNYNIIDNEVEKDPVNENPVIHSSGVKGALRSYFTEKGCSKTDILAWFGSEAKEKNNHMQGRLKFLEANMLARPLRGTDGIEPYYMVCSPESLKRYKDLCDIFEIDPKVNAVNDSKEHMAEQIALSSPITVSGSPVIYQMSQTDLSRCALPVIARNHLDNGISENLWYEELVPHETIMYFFILSEEIETLNAFKKKLEEAKVIQFGGNATIGYGLCKLTVRGDNA